MIVKFGRTALMAAAGLSMALGAPPRPPVSR